MQINEGASSEKNLLFIMWCLSRECAPVICIADVPTEADERKCCLTTAALEAVCGGGTSIQSALQLDGSTLRR